MSNNYDDYNNQGNKGNPVTFFLGIIIAAIGIFMVLKNTEVSSFSGFIYFDHRIPFGVVILPLLIGIVVLIAADKPILGWLLVIIGLVIILTGILMSINMYFKPVSAYELIIMFGLIAVGAGMILKGLYGKSK